MLEGRVVDRWEEGFDTWTPPRSAPSDDTGVDLDRESLLRLARELADKRHAEHDQSRAELEELKRTLRDRAAAVAVRERELERLERKGGIRRKEPKPARDDEALVARERAALERSQAVEARERELQARQAELEARAAEVAAREEALRRELDLATNERTQSESERQLAAAERERLDEREQAARRIEKELAQSRIELEQERERLEARAREVDARTRAVEGDEQAADPYAEREEELRALEARLEERDRELALVRQGLDAERNALLERERMLRRREVAEVRQSAGTPFAPPRFSDGLAAFARMRSRR